MSDGLTLAETLAQHGQIGYDDIEGCECGAEAADYPGYYVHIAAVAETWVRRQIPVFVTPDLPVDQPVMSDHLWVIPDRSDDKWTDWLAEIGYGFDWHNTTPPPCRPEDLGAAYVRATGEHDVQEWAGSIRAETGWV